MRRQQQRERGGLATLVVTGLIVSALAGPDAMAKSATAPKVLADFEDAEAVKLRPNEARLQRVPLDGGHGLKIVTEAEAPWPGVLVEPREGKWDLSAYYAVKMDVHNPQDVPVRVLLSVNNPGADGQRGCNTESVTVAPRAQGTLVVPFGNWHGDPGHPIDQANVVSLHVLLDRAGRSHTFVVDNIRAVAFDRSDVEKLLSGPFFQKLEPFHGRGVNLGNALEAPKEGAWGVTLEGKYFDLIRKAGFDSVRIPVRWNAHAEEAAPYTIDPELFARVDWAVENALARDLKAVVNIHHYDAIMKDPDGHRERFLALWEQIAGHYKDCPPELAFELLNEPHAKLTAGKWNRMLAEAIRVVRRTNPARKIVVGPVGWNAIKELPSLELPEEDRNLVVTVHYYEPFKFTHQGANWVGGQADQWLGTRWMGTPSEKRAVVRELDAAIAWAVEHRRPILLGEFGAYSKADIQSRARWTRFVAEEAARRKMGTAYWEFCSGFGVYDPDRGAWREPLLEALQGWEPGR